MSNLLVQNIKHTNNTTAMTVDSAGRILTPTRPAFQARGANEAYVQTNPVPFPTADINVGSCYNTSTYKFTAPIAGMYYFYHAVYHKNTAGEYGTTMYTKNDGTDGNVGAGGFFYNNDSGSMYTTISVPLLISLTANDTIKVAFLSGSSGEYWNGEHECIFGGYLLG